MASSFKLSPLFHLLLQHSNHHVLDLLRLVELRAESTVIGRSLGLVLHIVRHVSDCLDGDRTERGSEARCLVISCIRIE